MTMNEEEFLKRIRETFRIEAKEHLHVLLTGLTELEGSPPEKRISELIENLFREVHSLKGAARSVDQKDVESICHPMESLFSALKNRTITLSPSLFDILFKAVDLLTKLVASEGKSPTTVARQTQKELIVKLKEFVEGSDDKIKTESERVETTRPEQTPEKESVYESADKPVNVTEENLDYQRSEIVRIPVSRLDPLLFQAEELIQTKISLDQRIYDLKEVTSLISDLKKRIVNYRNISSSVAEDINYEDSESAGEDILQLEHQIYNLQNLLEKDQYLFDRLINDHLSEVKQMLMLPVSSIVEAFPSMVRQISREQGKEIKFTITGSELEVDKRILEELKDPLIHLIRNSLDHGIGMPHERLAENKPSFGSVDLRFRAKEGGMIEIVLSDDGKGINREKVIKAAIKSGVISMEAANNLNNDEIISLIFKSGVSTSSIITDISGRGLGLSIAYEKVERLNGKIYVETELSKGTSFHIALPVTLATFRGILVKSGEDMFLLPTTNIKKVLKIEPDDIKSVKNHDTIYVDNRVVLLVDLGEVMGLPERKNNHHDSIGDNSGQLRVIVLSSGENHVAFKIDDILKEEQVLVKSLGKLLKRVKNISGATILGSGKVVPVINVPDLIKSAIILDDKMIRPVVQSGSDNRTGNILIAEDSVTARALIKNILETAGYNVTTAIDGMDAFTKARTGDFDLIVSDVDMPRMNGFELTAKIRNDKKLNEKPVILVTALESREDRERGVEVGADAYIIKSSFDQTNLLEVIKKLI